MFAKHGPTIRTNNWKVTYLTADYRQRFLGLDDAVFVDLSNSVDVVIHNAWKVELQTFA